MRPRRAYYLILSLSYSKKLTITFRRFRTTEARRSKAIRQLVISIHLGSIREIAVKLENKKRPPKKPVQNLNSLKLHSSASLLFIFLGLLGVTFFTVRMVEARALEPPQIFSSAASIPTIASLALPASVPTHLSIPSLGIDAGVITVGQDSTGGIQMPPLFDWTTGWYKYSPTPGQLGPSIIVGHVDTYKSISVFWKLRYIQQGDVIDVTRADGKVVQFRVLALQQFDQNNFPTQQVYGNIKYPGLRLITCGGAFDTQTGSYTQNTVVYASMIFAN